MTNKLLIPRALFLTADNGALPVARAIMGTCGETVYGDTDNQKTERGKFPNVRKPLALNKGESGRIVVRVLQKVHMKVCLLVRARV